THPLSLHDALPISGARRRGAPPGRTGSVRAARCGRIPSPRDRRAHGDRGGNFEGTAVPGAPAVAGGVEQMMCSDREAQLNEYVDGTLATGARALVETHLAQCAGCREAVAELRALVDGARGLPRTIEPASELWAGIAGRIGKRETGKGKRWWGGALAAAATLVIGFAIY